MNSIDLPLAVFIVDDEPPARHRLKELLTDCIAQISLELIGEAANGRDALEQLTERHADVVLVDIRMPEMDGIELAQHLNKLDNPPVIIFTTAYDNYAIQAFELKAIDYLLKPIRLGRLFEALTRARTAIPIKTEVLQELMPEPRKNLSIQQRGKILLIPIESILYLRAELKYVTVHTSDIDYLSEEPLGALEKEFAARFIRIHRNCLVAKDEIESFEKIADEGEESHWVVKLKGSEERLPISRRQQAIVKEYKPHK
jgi:two-component system, LytTR family, response regulator AlgR